MNPTANNTLYDTPSENIYGSVEGKIRAVASQFENCDYYFADFAQANVAFDRISKPTILYVLPADGKLYLDTRRSQFTDSPSVQLWFVCPSDFDFEGVDNECRIEAMKRIGMRFIKALNDSGMFEVIDGEIPYQVAYDAYDENLTGICLTPKLKELQGLTYCDGDITRKPFEV